MNIELIKEIEDYLQQLKNGALIKREVFTPYYEKMTGKGCKWSNCISCINTMIREMEIHLLKYRSLL